MTKQSTAALLATMLALTANIPQMPGTPDLKYTRSRRERLDKLAQYWGYKSWCEYETYVLNYGGVNGMRWSLQKPIWITEDVA
jgi:hypothetical protein